MSASCRLCCKSLFALVIKNSPGFRCDLRVKMWGTSSPGDKLTGEFGNAIEATQIASRRLVRVGAGNLSPGNFGLLQHNRARKGHTQCSKKIYSITSSASASNLCGTSRPSILAV
jgi:hypothetical protein